MSCSLGVLVQSHSLTVSFSNLFWPLLNIDRKQEGEMGMTTRVPVWNSTRDVAVMWYV